jgi:uncharacterized protein YndB with AHSA1/START domain
MNALDLSTVPVVRTGLLIRRPPAAVFEAFVDPASTTQFWFTGSTGRLETGKTVRWDWKMYGVSAEVVVKAAEPHSRILIAWGGPGETPTDVEWTFRSHRDGTFVEIVNSGFEGDGDGVVAQALDSMGGFSLVLAGAKALLEHNIRLNLVPDRFPAGLAEHA